jgi:hypothetical protein
VIQLADAAADHVQPVGAVTWTPEVEAAAAAVAAVGLIV